MLLQRLILPILALGAALPAFAQQKVSTQTLDNGMQVVVIEDHRAPVAVNMVWYKAGSADEPPGASGIAHFLEHLMFKGTENLESGAFSRTVTRNGGSDNAFTSYDYTAYFQRVAADRVPLMMEMEAERMVHLRLVEEDILTERDVVIEERNQRTENDPAALMREQMRAALYLNHRYGVPIIGWRHEMVSLDMQDAMDFYEANYAPNNAIAIVAGDVEPEEVFALAKEHYGALPANPEITERSRPSEPPHTAPRRMVFADPRVAQPYLMRTYLAPERDPGAQRTAAALLLLSEILGGSQTSVLAEALQFETSKAVYAGAGYSATSLDDTSFTLIMVPSQGVSLEEGEAAMDDVVSKFLEAGEVDGDQLDRIKRQIRASQIYAQDNVQSVANRYGRAMAAGLTIEDVQEWPEILQSITSDEIMAAAREVFNLDRSVTAYLTRAEQPKAEVSQ